MTNKVTHAPKAVIEKLDKLKNTDMIYELFEQGSVLDANTYGDNNVVDSWVYEVEDGPILQRELAVINHVFNNERLQPERDPRWYVEKDGGIIQIDIDGVPELLSGHNQLEYELCMTEAQARGYAELFGGEAKEIK
ncbi:hypothetical protein [Weissella tructae]|uniref:hypothetical protein n=1 Tax=Weissella tructae TaxID=887702 RepID=UPI001BDC67BC|nr:hypothetical protein [Weissella tructae]QVV90842.1 hypothetical protein KHQ32_04200 [Weissella tructae]